MFKRILDDPEFQDTLMSLYATKVYRRGRQEPTPVEIPHGWLVRTPSTPRPNER